MIHEYLEDAFMDNLDEVDPFSKAIVTNSCDYDRIVVDICIVLETYEIRRSNRAIQFKRTNLNI